MTLNEIKYIAFIKPPLHTVLTFQVNLIAQSYYLLPIIFVFTIVIQDSMALSGVVLDLIVCYLKSIFKVPKEMDLPFVKSL